MTNSATPRDSFSRILSANRPNASAWIRGSAFYPQLSGYAKFYSTPYEGILIEAQIFGLPNLPYPGSSAFYAFHIHENGNCTGTRRNPFQNAGLHYNPQHTLHPGHAGDLPPLLANQGYAWSAFYDKRFTLNEIIGKSVIIHAMPDDFHTQPSGNSGEMIGCGVIEAMS